MSDKKTAGAGASRAFRRYLDGKLSSNDYLRESRRETNAEVRREIKRTAREKVA